MDLDAGVAHKTALNLYLGTLILKPSSVGMAEQSPDPGVVSSR